MTTLLLLMILLPIVFMIHDFEEIIMFQPWLSKNKTELKERFPMFFTFLKKNNLFTLSTSEFAIGVLHMFLLISAVSYWAIYTQNYQWWFGAFMAYFIHLFMHIGQWIIYRKYVPVIITSLLSLPYCFYALYVFVQAEILSLSQMFLWAIIGCSIAILNFPLAFFWAKKFQKRITSSLKT
ncbi:HXXEE domain-containing protein [Capnocytophaga catalasegens]|uniref:Membrane protein n=1 Tax=Capnocytophaga catalasegens TaxID=1004260 RepID=A0AAV5AWW5_9FLAO|nr:HXXEE domain-containing protein [Capnocytophaga catalasegens]GIZ16051.1 membrane protein [Capnocytophaga catalasegens]GJM50210.1 membrane protein [Capnocytophaga catalasegens]GJM53441.1 membrane protein [Capnocytophaga catalasegens]